MCTCGAHHNERVTRRGLLAGIAALAAAAPLAAFAATDDPTEPAAGANNAGKLVATTLEKPPPAAPASPVAGALAGSIRRVDPSNGQKCIALTFDLCQRGRHAGFDAKIVAYLQSERVPATFFAGGLWLKSHPGPAAALAAEPLFAFGNHSWSHRNLHSSSEAAIADEFLVTETALAEATGGRRTTRLFRFPYGSCSSSALAAANAVGAIVIQWDTVSGDPDGTPGKTIQRNVMTHIRPGSIVVMHANGRGTHTAEALKSIVPALRGQGYRLVTVPDLLATGTPVATDACYIDHPGDTRRYDAIADRRTAPKPKAPVASTPALFRWP